MAGAGKEGRAGKGKRKAAPGDGEVADEGPKEEVEKKGKKRSGKMAAGPVGEDENEGDAAKEKKPASRNGKQARTGRKGVAQVEDGASPSSRKEPKTKKKNSSTDKTEPGAAGERRSTRAKR